MSKRVYELAKEMGVTSAALVAAMKKVKINKSPVASLTDDEIRKVKKLRIADNIDFDKGGKRTSVIKQSREANSVNGKGRKKKMNNTKESFAGNRVHVKEGEIFIKNAGIEISLSDYYSMTFNKLKELQGEKIIVVNAGRMNHGKSSLFNALANDKNMFDTADVRCTKKCMRKEFADGIDFIDTPGLDATDADDKEAFDAYKKADMIIFVHTPNIGELHRNEVEWIKRICDSYPSPDEFWKRFCLVFTFKEAIPDSEFKVIEEKVKEHILNYCGGKDYTVFKVSNSDYWDGTDTSDKELIELSGIGKLRQFLIDQSLKLKDVSQALRMKRAKKIKADSVNVLEEAKEEVDDVRSDKITEKNRVKEGLFKDLSDLIASEQTLGSL